MSPAAGYSFPLPFKISRDPAQGTGQEPVKVVQRPVRLTKPGGDEPSTPRPPRPSWEWIVEALLVAACFLLYAGTPAPDVNESHYLTKAAHFWNSAWCPGDLFLGSSFSHWLFYVCFGWLTKFMSLTAFAWTGRVITCLLMGFAWRRLSHAVVPL